MKLLILSEAEIKTLLPMSDCLTLVSDALSALAKGEVFQPLRSVLRAPEATGLMGLMPAYCSSLGKEAYGLKALCVFPQNSSFGKDAHQGGVLLFSAQTGELLALCNASAITALRTAAASGVATEVLARKGEQKLALLGTGVQAKAHLEAMACARPIQHVKVASRFFENAIRFVEEVSMRYPFSIEAVKSAEVAVRGADLIVTVTNATEPIVKWNWITPGAHINAVGACVPSARELDSETVVNSRFFVDKRESALHESGDYLFPVRENKIGPDHIQAELGEVIAEQKPGRRSNEEITLFKSLGIAIEDLAVATYLYEKARQDQSGTWVDF